MPITPGFCSDCDGGGGSGFTPEETLVVGPATGTFTDITGLYHVPANATMVMWEALAGGGGGASGSTISSGLQQLGAGGGGGGGFTRRWVSAAALRAAYPGGVPYNVGHGGAGAPTNTLPQGSTPLNNGTVGQVGGFTFAGDFIVATPGNLYNPPAGGGYGDDSGPSDGSFGLGDTPGGIGGEGGGVWQFNLDGAPVSDFTGGAGGYPGFLYGNAGANNVAQIQIGGGGGGGGGSGGIPSGTPEAFPGGNSGFATTADPTPISGLGGLVDSTPPTAAGNSVLGAGVVPVQGGGGGGASSITTNGQAGASALQGSGSGGGGGGPSSVGTGGAGGNGGSGYLRVVAF